MIKYLETKDAITVFLPSGMKQAPAGSQSYETLKRIISHFLDEEAAQLAVGIFSYRDDDIELDVNVDGVSEIYFEGKYYEIPVEMINVARASVVDGELTAKGFASFLTKLLKTRIALRELAHLFTKTSLITEKGDFIFMINSQDEAPGAYPTNKINLTYEVNESRAVSEKTPAASKVLARVDLSKMETTIDNEVIVRGYDIVTDAFGIEKFRDVLNLLDVS
jgi:hypothetical protein